MDRVWTIMKEHPYLVGGSILGLVVIIYIFWTRGSSSSSGGGIYAYSADPNLVAQQTSEANTNSNNNASISMAGIQLQALQDYDASNLSAVQSNNATSVSIAELAAKSSFAFDAIGSIVGVGSTQSSFKGHSTTGSDGGTGTGGGQDVTSSSLGYSLGSAQQIGVPNYKSWLLVLEDSLFGSSSADTGTYTGPAGQTVTGAGAAAWGKFLGWIGGTAPSPAMASGGPPAVSWDLNPRNPFYSTSQGTTGGGRTGGRGK